MRDVFIDVELPIVHQGYKYLGCHIVWTEVPLIREVERASQRVKDKARKFAFRFGTLRNDVKVNIFNAYILQEYEYRLFPLVQNEFQLQVMRSEFTKLYRKVNRIPNYVSNEQILNSKVMPDVVGHYFLRTYRVARKYPYDELDLADQKERRLE